MPFEEYFDLVFQSSLQHPSRPILDDLVEEASGVLNGFKLQNFVPTHWFRSIECLVLHLGVLLVPSLGR
jgi:hypothetical protein